MLSPADKLKKKADALYFMAELEDDELTRLVKAAKEHRAKKLIDSIPKEQLASLKAKYDRWQIGQTISFYVRPTLLFTVGVMAHYEYGTVDEWDVRLVDGGEREKGFFETFDLKSWLFDEPGEELARMHPEIHDLMQQETAVFNEWEREYYRVRDEFGVDGCALIDLMSEEEDEPEDVQQAQDDKEGD